MEKTQESQAQDDHDQPDLFSASLEVCRPSKRSPQKLRGSGLQVTQVSWPDGWSAEPLTFLCNAATGKSTLWVLDSGLGDLVEALVKERQTAEASQWEEAASEDGLTYDHAGRKWVFRWSALRTSDPCEVFVKVDKRARTSSGHAILSPDSFLASKMRARKRVKAQARELGCPVVSDSEDDEDNAATGSGA